MSPTDLPPPSEPLAIDGEDRTSILRDHVLPLGFYLLSFALLTWPALRSFSTGYFAGCYDLYSNVWNLWWFNKSITQLHQSPYHTTWLFYPDGTTLLGHTLGPFNGLLGIPLQRVLSIVQVHNALLVLTFVTSGWTMYTLARALTGSRGAALLAGHLFTFSAYHVAQAACHLQLATLQWVPLCLLGLLRLFERPSLARALLAAGAVFLVAISDLYYLFYCAIAGALLYIVRARELRAALFAFRRPYALPVAAFALAAAATSGIAIVLILRANQRDPFLGGHSAVIYSADLFAAFIPGGFWRFGSWTAGYWERFRAGPLETSVYVGWAVLVLAAIGWSRRALHGSTAVRWFAFVAVVFFVLSLGPNLRVWGVDTKFPMPYRLMERTIPAFRMTGMPVRMMMMASLSLIVLAAYGWTELARGSASAVAARPGKRNVVMTALLALVVFETLPKPIDVVSPDVPAWVHALGRLPGTGGVIDGMTEPWTGVYYQTIHGKPIAAGYISKEPSTVAEDKLRKRLALRRGNFGELRDRWGVDYVIAPASRPIESLPVAYEDETVRIYSLRTNGPDGSKNHGNHDSTHP